MNVYKMSDAKTGKRNERFLWRCRDCKEQYTVRIGTVYEESRIELRHWWEWPFPEGCRRDTNPGAVRGCVVSV